MGESGRGWRRDRLVLFKDDETRDGDDVVARQVGATGVFAEGIGIGGLENAHRADATAGFGGEVGADPADAIGELVPTNARAATRGFFELGRTRVAGAPEDQEGFHAVVGGWVNGAEERVGGSPGEARRPAQDARSARRVSFSGSDHFLISQSGERRSIWLLRGEIGP